MFFCSAASNLFLSLRDIEKFLSLYVEKNLVVAYNVEGTFVLQMKHAA